MSNTVNLKFRERNNQDLTPYTLAIRNVRYSSFKKLNNNEAKCKISKTIRWNHYDYVINMSVLVTDCKKVFDNYSYHTNNLDYYHYKKSENAIDEILIEGNYSSAEPTQQTLYIGDEDIIIKSSISQGAQAQKASKRKRRKKKKQAINDVVHLSKESMDYMSEQYNKFKPRSTYNIHQLDSRTTYQESIVPYTVSWSAAHPFHGGLPQ